MASVSDETATKSKPHIIPDYELLSRSYVHGVNDVLQASNSISKVSWTLIMLVSVAAVGYGVYKSVHDYRTSPIMTSSSIKPIESIPFPSVYICPHQVVDKRTVSEGTATDIKWAKNFFSIGRPGDGIIGQLSTISELLESLNEHPALIGSFGNPESIEQYFLQVGFATSTIFRECQFGRKTFECDKVIKRIFDKDFGICYLIEKSFMQISEGSGLALVIDTNRGLWPHLPPLNGISVAISEILDPTESSATMFFIQTGGKTKVVLSAINTKLINIDSHTTSQQCKAEQARPYLHYRVLTNLTYSHAACKMDCIQQTIIKECKCSLPLASAYLKEKYRKTCWPNETQTCFIDGVVGEKQEELRKCRANCLTPCQSWEYSCQLSFAPFIRETPLAQDDITQRENNSDLILLEIAFGAMQYTEVLQSISMTPETFLSNVGGQMGLWLGASILSLIQLLSFALMSCYNKFGKRHI